ncbi:MAG: FadR/GntR family transcriptional regulator [Micromonosporaceae bacterium]
MTGTRQANRDASRTAAVSIAHELVSRIEAGAVQVGTVLPAEAELAAEFGVSRPSVREALSALQFAGYIEPRRGRGTLVLTASPVPGKAAHVRAAGSLAEVVDLLEARLVVEPETVALAASDPDPQALDQAAAIAQGMTLAVEDNAVAADTDHRLHIAIANVCRNTELREHLISLLNRASGPCWRTAQEAAWRDRADLPQQWARHHAVIVDALAQGDHQRARAESRAHLLTAVQNAAGCAAMPPSLRRRLRQMHTYHSAI